MNFDWEDMFVRALMFFVVVVLVLGSVALFLVVHHFWIEEFSQSVHRVNKSEVIANEKLEKWYRGYNEEYFANELPKNTTVKWANLTSQNDIGMTELLSSGDWVIFIDRAKNPSPVQARLTLLHESCHVHTYTRGMLEFEIHGPKFQACMMQLAHQGAFKELW